MKQFYFFIILINLFIIPIKAEVITLRADSWCPFNCDPSSKDPGFIIEIAKAIFEPLGHKIDYQVMPWNRALKEVESGKFNAAVGTDVNEAPHLFFHKEEVAAIKHAFYVKKGNPWRYEGIKSLANVRLGVILGYNYDYVNINPYIEANKKNRNLIQLVSGPNPLERNIQKLKLGRIDVLLETAQVFEYTNGKLGISMNEYTEAGTIYQVNSNNTKQIPIFLGLAPKNPKSKEYAQIIDAGLIRLRETGELEKILKKYNLSYWK